MNNVNLIGRLTRDPELKYLTTGTAVSNFNLAVDKGLSREKKIELTAKGEPTADFINVTVWGKPAENVANYMKKGSQIGVSGRIATRSYEDNLGNKRYITEVIAREVKFLDSRKDNDNSNMEGFFPVDTDDIPFR